MAKYLITGSYTQKGMEGLLKDGGTGRREALKKAVEAFGGKLEALYYAFGENDFYIIEDLPDNVTMTAGLLAVAATGATKTKTVVLLAPEEVDAAVGKAKSLGASYRAPGQ